MYQQEDDENQRGCVYVCIYIGYPIYRGLYGLYGICIYMSHMYPVYIYIDVDVSFSMAKVTSLRHWVWPLDHLGANVSAQCHMDVYDVWVTVGRRQEFQEYTPEYTIICIAIDIKIDIVCTGFLQLQGYKHSAPSLGTLAMRLDGALVVDLADEGMLMTWGGTVLETEHFFAAAKKTAVAPLSLYLYRTLLYLWFHSMMIMMCFLKHQFLDHSIYHLICWLLHSIRVDLSMIPWLLNRSFDSLWELSMLHLLCFQKFCGNLAFPPWMPRKPLDIARWETSSKLFAHFA